MIKREYHTKEECVGLFMEEDFERIPSWIITDADGWYERWEFWGLLDDEDKYDQDAEDEYGYTHEPMWNTWFIPDDYVMRFVGDNPEEVADMGFTLIYYDGDLVALGIDGAGYSFRDSHFTRLYDALGFTWHD